MREVAGANLDLRTFSYVPEADEAFSEERWVDEVNARSRAHGHKVTMRLDEWESDVGTLVRRQAEPFGSIAIAAQQALFRRCAQEGVRVVLEGQGADELFGGYAYARGFRLASQLRRGQVTPAWNHLRTFHRTNGRRATRGLVVHTARLLAPESMVSAARKMRRPAVGLANTSWSRNERSLRVARCQSAGYVC